jgi:hypothetical protein
MKSQGAAIIPKSDMMDKAKGMIKTNDAPVIPKSDMMATTSTPAAAPVNCPAGTKDAGNGTCMITGDWEP